MHSLSTAQLHEEKGNFFYRKACGIEHPMCYTTFKTFWSLWLASVDVKVYMHHTNSLMDILHHLKDWVPDTEKYIVRSIVVILC